MIIPYHFTHFKTETKQGKEEVRCKRIVAYNIRVGIGVIMIFSDMTERDLRRRWRESQIDRHPSTRTLPAKV